MRNICDFYQEAKISRELPTIKSVKKSQKDMLHGITLQKAYSLWKQDNKNLVDVVSFSLFQKLCPDFVLLQSKTKLNQCLCEICTDILLKLQSLNQVLVSLKKSDLKIKDKYELTELTMCPKASAGKYNR